MARHSKVRLLKQIKTEDRWLLARVLYDKKGRIRKDRFLVHAEEQVHPEGTYFLEWSNGDGRRHKEAVGPDALTADERLRIKQAELNAVRNGVKLAESPAAGNDGAVDALPLSVAVDKYIDYIQQHRSLRTYRTYRPILNAFKESCTKPTIAEVDRQDLLDFASACKKQGQNAKSIYNKLVVLSQMLKSNGKPKVLDSGDWPKVVETVRPKYETEELEKLFAACDPDERVMFTFFLLTGFRDQEARYVTWRDVDFTNNAVRVTAKLHWDFHPKNYEEREVPVPNTLIQMLEKFRPADAKLDDPVFPSETGRPNGAMIETLKQIAYRGKLNCGHCRTKHGNRCADGPFCKRWFLHKFRHTYATTHLRDGVDIRTLQLWMGHRDIASTMVYLKGIQSHEAQAKISNGTLAKFAVGSGV